MSDRGDAHAASRRITAVVFDLDDTLYPERAFAFSGFVAVATAFAEVLGETDAAVGRMKELFDSDRRKVFHAILEQRGVPLPVADRIVPDMIETYRRHDPSIELHPDSTAAIHRLRSRFRLGIITDGPADVQRSKIRALALTPLVDAIILTAELGLNLGKPHPRAFELMAAELSAEHAACAYVADNAAKDFVAPNRLGWMTVQIRRKGGVYENHPAPPGGTADFTIGHFNELDSLL